MSDEYLYHGTTIHYLPYILKDGINGMYPEDIYILLKKYYEKCLELRKRNLIDFDTRYISDFFQRQKDIRENPDEIRISMGTTLIAANEYANGGRNRGEGPGRLIDFLILHPEYFDTTTDPDLFTLYNIFGVGREELCKKKSGIVLAFKITDIKKSLKDNLEFDETSFDEEVRNFKASGELVFRHPLPANIIRVVKIINSDTPRITRKNNKTVNEDIITYLKDYTCYYEHLSAMRENESDLRSTAITPSRYPQRDELTRICGLPSIKITWETLYNLEPNALGQPLGANCHFNYVGGYTPRKLSKDDGSEYFYKIVIEPLKKGGVKRRRTKRRTKRINNKSKRRKR